MALVSFWPSAGQHGDVAADEELVNRCLSGDEDAFMLFYEKYRRLVCKAVCRILLDPEETQDVTQEIFFQIFRSLSLWNPRRARLLPWIYRIATNRAIDFWRMRRKRAEESWADSQHKLPAHDARWYLSTRAMDQSLAHKERIALVGSLLENLPQPQRQFIVLYYRDGLKLREIAEREGYKLGTVKSALYRATRTMRCRLASLST